MKLEDAKSNRHNYIDLIRAIACVFVVMIHVSGNDMAYATSSLDFCVATLLNCIGMNGVPLFFMISGALMLNENYQISIKKLLFDKVGKLLIAYYGACFFYNLVPFLLGWVPFEWYTLRECLIEGTIYELGVYHLWFIPVLVSMYFLVPVLKDAFSKKSTCVYFLCFFLIAGIVFSTLNLFNLPGQISRLVNHVGNKYFIFMVTGYLGYFVLGHYLHTFVNKKLSKKIKIVLSAVTTIAVLLTFGGCLWDSSKTENASTLYNTPFNLSVFVSSIGLFLLLKDCEGKLYSVKWMNAIKTFASYSLGIYLIHPFVLNILESNVNAGFIPVYFVSVIIRIVIVVAITFSITYVLKKLPGIRKIL